MSLPPASSSSPATTREAARGTGLILAGALVAQAAEYAYRFTMARGLGVEAFGTFNQARAVYLVLVALAPLGLGAGVKRFVAVMRESGAGREARRAIADGARIAAVSSLVLGIALAVLAAPIAAALRNPALESPLRVLAFALPAAVGLAFATRLGEAFRSFRPTVIGRQILDPALRVVFSAPLLATGATLAVVLTGVGAAALVAFLVAAFLVRRLELLRALPRGPSPRVLPDLLQFSLPIAAGGVLFDLAERVDVLMIGFYLDESAVGVYSSASTIARFLFLFLASTMPVVATLSAEHAGRGSVEEIARLQRTTARWMLFSTGPFAAGFLLFPEEAITILFGREFAAGAASLRILIPACLVPILAGPIGLFLDALGKSRWSLGNMIVRTSLNVLLNLVLIPRLGIAGAALGTLISLVVANGLFWIQLGTLVPLRGNYAGWGRPLLVLLAASGSSWATAAVLRLVLPGEGGALAAAFLAGIVLLAAFGFGVRRVPGCLEREDLEIARVVRDRLRRFMGR